MSILLDIPPDVSLSILFEWIGLVKSIKLDLALSSSHRNYFHRLLKQYSPYSFNVEEETLLTRLKIDRITAIFIWMSNRQIICRCLHLTSHSFDIKSNLKWKLDNEFIDNIRVCSASEKDKNAIVHTINSCNNLRSLILSTGSLQLTQIYPSIFQSLLSLVLNDFQRDGAISHIAKHCRSLLSFEYEWCKFHMIKEVRILISNNRYLRSLKIRSDLSILNTIAECCDAIEDVDIRSLVSSSNVVFHFIETKSTIKQLRINMYNVHEYGENLMRSIYYENKNNVKKLEIKAYFDHFSVDFPISCQVDLQSIRLEYNQIDTKMPCVLSFLKQSSPTLTNLDIDTGDSLIDLEFLRSILTEFPKLNALDICIPKKKSDIASIFVESSPINLKSLIFMGHPISATDAISIMQAIPNLEEVFFTIKHSDGSKYLGYLKEKCIAEIEFLK